MKHRKRFEEFVQQMKPINYQEYKYYDIEVEHILNIAKDKGYCIEYYLIDTKNEYGCNITITNDNSNENRKTFIQDIEDITARINQVCNTHIHKNSAGKLK